MKTISIHALLISTALMLAGCFEIIEEITLNDDGSGHIEVTLNISRSKTKLNSIMLMDSIHNYKVPSREDIRTAVERITTEITKVDGVSNVHRTVDFEDYIFSISCDFADIESLNKIVTHFSTNEHVKLNTDHKQFVYDRSTKKFKRDYHYNLANEISKVGKKDRKILEDASVTTIYRFQSTVNTATNEDARISSSKKAVMLKVGAQELINQNKDLKNTIQLN